MAAEAGYYNYDAANTAWVKLYVNGDFHGVYTSTEQRDEQLLRNRDLYSPTNTWLYKVDGGTTLEAGVGESPTFQHLDFAPFAENGGSGGSGPDLEIDLPQWIDMESMLTLGACNAYVENNDELFKKNGKNSFAVDFEPPNQRLRMYFPWDQDSSIKQGSQSIDKNNLIFDEPWFQRVYEHTLREMIEGPLSESSLHAFLNDLEAVLAPELASDPFITSGAGDFASLRSWVTNRNANVLGQLTLPFVARPVFNQDGGEVVSGFGLTMIAPAGQVYYTLDGTDPRVPGGGLSPSAQLYSAPVSVDRTLQVVARTLDGSNWSGLATKAIFNITDYATALRVTEIMYKPVDADPGDAIDNDDYEFIEIRNTGATDLDVSGFFFEGITYTFPAGTVIPAGGYVVLVRSATAFAARYPGVTIDGIYLSKLSNGGEKVRLKNADGTTVISVEYDDDPPWVISPDGLDYSLVNINVDGDPDDAANWRASTNVHGSPGEADPAPPYPVGLVMNEVLAHAASPFEDAVEILNADNTTAVLDGWFLSNESRDGLGDLDPARLKKYKLPAGTSVPAGGFAVFYENDFLTSNPDIPFSLSELGGRVFLSSADAAGNLTGHIIAIDYPAADPGVSFGRTLTSVGPEDTLLDSTTFGVSAPASVADFRTGTGAANSAPKVGPVVLSEIMYNPVDTNSEFVELYNITGASVDISGWDIDGIGGFAFPAGTSIPAGGFVLLIDTAKTDAITFRADYGVPAAVPIFEDLFDLGNAGESLRLEKPNPNPLGPDIRIERVRYNDNAPWPTEADGAGPSLERFVVSGYGNEPLNWRATVLGGSPGQPGDFAEGIAIAQNSSWDYKVTVSALAVGWPEVTYNASSWSDGPGVLGYGETFLSTVIPFGPDPLNRYPTTYFRKPFVVNDDPATITALTLTILGDDGVAVYLNGKEVVRRSLPTGTLTYNTLATDTEATTYETIDLLAFKDCLVQGGNVLAVEVHQSGPTSTDLVWDAGLTYSTVSTAVDSDGDGMTDDWEIANGLNPGDPSDVDHDLDGDGQDSLGEFIAGTDPNDPYSVFRLTRVEFMPIGAWQVEWTSVPGKEYRVEYSPDMDTWFSFGVVGEIIATGATTQFADPSASPAEQRFYRVAVLASP